MATYIVLASFTDQGIRNVKDTVKRAEAAMEATKKLGATMKNIHWTVGRYDLVIEFDAPDDETMTAVCLNAGLNGHIRTQTLRAFSKKDMAAILAKLK
jgi:uncharacterized protein with GYD domain